MNLTDDYLLGSRLHYAQPLNGYRTGIEPVLLAACVPAKPGDHVLEAGCGAGAGLMCLAARVAGLEGTGLEIDAVTAALAAENLRRNGLSACEVINANLLEWRSEHAFDHIFANPPWHDEKSSASPHAGIDRAKRARKGLLEAWIDAMLAMLKPGGSISLILPAGQFAAAAAALQAGRAGAVTLLPLWPRAGRAAKLVIIQARAQRKSPAQVLPGLVLHEGEGYSAQAEAVLRQGLALS